MNAKRKQESSKFLEVSLSNIMLDKYQTRRYFDKESLDRLAASMKLVGLLQPIGVSPLSKSSWQLIYGERRLRAACRLGWETIDVKVHEADNELGRLALQMNENGQHDSLSLLEIFDAVDRFEKQHVSSSMISEVLCRPAAWVDSLVEIVRDPLARSMFESGTMSQVETWSHFKTIPPNLRRALLRGGEPISLQRCKKTLAASAAQAQS